MSAWLLSAQIISDDGLIFSVQKIILYNVPYFDRFVLFKKSLFKKLLPNEVEYALFSCFYHSAVTETLNEKHSRELPALATTPDSCLFYTDQCLSSIRPFSYTALTHSLTALMIINFAQSEASSAYEKISSCQYDVWFFFSLLWTSELCLIIAD